jgi:hypothetical protein
MTALAVRNGGQRSTTFVLEAVQRGSILGRSLTVQFSP